MAVQRAIRLHLSAFTKSEVAELRVGEESLFAFTRREWTKRRSAQSNLPPVWWEKTRDLVQGLPPATLSIPVTDPLQAIDQGIKAGLEQITHKNLPAARR